MVVHPLRNFKAKRFLLPGVAVFSVLYNLPKVSELRCERKHLLFAEKTKKSVREMKFSRGFSLPFSSSPVLSYAGAAPADVRNFVRTCRSSSNLRMHSANGMTCISPEEKGRQKCIIYCAFSSSCQQ